jgi:REP element-mobilizing transposase RayT
MDRYWLLTWTAYGSWLPGDARGFVGDVREEGGDKVRHNTPGTRCDADMPGLRRFAQEAMTAAPVRLSLEQARVLAEQFRETARFRGWELLALAVMANHVHLVVGVPGDPDPEKLLGDFKAYATRALNHGWGRRPNGRWWTQSGSKRKLSSAEAVHDAVVYVSERQPYPLVTWAGTNALTPGPEDARAAE